MFGYPVILTPDDNNTILVQFPDVPEALTFGEDEDEALLQAVDALETALSFYVEERKPLPRPSKPVPGQKIVCPGVSECAKLGIYQSMVEQGLRKSELARRLGWHMPQIDRLFDLNHASKLEQMEMAARALGQKLSFSLAPQ